MGVVAVAGLLALAPVSSTVYAATSAVTTNNTATKNDLLNADIIDESKTGSISIYKYDITAAEAAGEYKAGTYKATGEADSRVESALKDYAIEGGTVFLFTCWKCRNTQRAGGHRNNR